MILGREHPTTLTMMLNMAEFYEALGNKVNALKALDEAEPVIAQKLGNDHSRYNLCQEIRTRVNALDDLSIHAITPSRRTESAAIPASSSQNVARPSRRGGL
jgi:hypothetical protein